MERVIGYSSRGSPQLCINGNEKYSLNYEGKNGQKRWRCINKNCFGKIITFGKNDEVDWSKSNLTHTHSPGPLSTLSKKISYSPINADPKKLEKKQAGFQNYNVKTHIMDYDDIVRARQIIKKKYNDLRRNEIQDSARLNECSTLVVKQTMTDKGMKPKFSQKMINTRGESLETNSCFPSHQMKENKEEKSTGKNVFGWFKTRWGFLSDPNELVERLSLLIALKRAGQSGLEREILNIEEQLREREYIL